MTSRSAESVKGLAMLHAYTKQEKTGMKRTKEQSTKGLEYASQQPSSVQQSGEQEMKKEITSAAEWPESQPPPSAQDDRDQTKLSSKNTRTPTHNKIFNMGMPVYVSTTANPKAKILVYAFLDLHQITLHNKRLSQKAEATTAWKKIGRSGNDGW
ncbi:hypothetical protein EB796_009222 [Bugula neritina]|uniref:Uncharacterized protein n=1 Tax=Bugula neritina TaxID=10212 RepID=A0A7J7K483_BUGNE|nr:hypothetical protein EB796_009222 [Bugula neritina]